VWRNLVLSENHHDSRECNSSKKDLIRRVIAGPEKKQTKREEPSKPRECVLVWDDTTESFTLHPLPTTLHLTLNRALSKSKIPSSKAPSETSSSSSVSVPLAKRKAQDEEFHAQSQFQSHSRSSTGGSASAGAPTVVLGEEITPKAKKSRGSEVSISPIASTSASRASKGGKSLPRKTPAATKPKAPSPKKTAKKANAKSTKGPKAKAAPQPRGKVKSAEIIEDSDVDDDGEDEGDGGAEGEGDGDGEGEEEDIFAKMVGESLAAEDEEDDDDDEGEEEDDEENELGGARLVVDDNSEWI